MKLQLNIKYQQTDYTDKEINIITDIFGIPCNNIYFNLKVNEEIDNKYKFINFTGISGSGKTIIKNKIKNLLLIEKKYILDFDDLLNFEKKYNDINILELFNIKSSSDEILKILGGFGLFEMRILLSKIKLLSQGQRTRLKYIWLIFNLSDSETTHVLID